MIIIIQKHKDALEALYKEHKKFLFIIARNSTNDYMLAEDIVEETFERAIFHLNWLRDQNRYQQYGYLRKICTNLCCDIGRERDRIMLHAHDDQVWEELSTEDNHLDWLDRETVRQYIGLLDGLERDAMMKHYYYGYSVTQIAAWDNVPVNTVSKRLSRGRNRLREILRGLR